MRQKESYPEVVACLPTRNAATFISKTLESLAGQTYPSLRILISDDASSDGTPDICAEFAEKDGRFTIFHQSENLGWVGNSQYLLERASGSYIFFAYHDDQLHPDYVSQLVGALEQNPKAVLAFSDVQTVDTGGRKTICSFTDIENTDSLEDRVLAVVRREPNWWVAAHGVFRSEVVDAVGGPQRHLGGEVAADWPWILGMAIEGDFVRIPAALCIKFKKKKSVSGTWRRHSASFLAVVLACGWRVFKSRLPARVQLSLYLELIRVWWTERHSFAGSSTWARYRKKALRILRHLIPADEVLIVVDQDEWDIGGLSGHDTLPFPERGGLYWGPPDTGQAAVKELNRLRESGARYIAICWPAFWWLEAYPELDRELQENHRCLYRAKSVIVFQLI